MLRTSFLRRVGAAGSLALSLLCACYQPALPDGQFQCAADSECPEGLLCVGGRCNRAGSGGDGGASMNTGCKGVAANVAPDVWACKGSFDPGKAQELCQTGYHVCKADLDLAALTKVQRCDGGFFAISIDAGYKSETIKCPPEGSRVVIGCGGEFGSLPVGKLECGLLSALPSFRSFVLCENPLDAWGCTTGIGDLRHSRSDVGGVLCCKG